MQTSPLLWSLLLATQPLLAADAQPAVATTGSTLIQSLPAEQILWLNDGKDKFLSLLIPDQSGQPKGAAIILHDAGGHPDWPEVIRPLRTTLPLHGWATLSIQLPDSNSPSGYVKQQESINSRIQKAAEHLRSIGLNNIALIGHGSGALAAASYLSKQNSDPGIRGFVGISMEVIKRDNASDYLPTQLEKIQLPILDIFGSRDLDVVTNTADLRSLAARRSGNTASREQLLEPYKMGGLSKRANNNVQGYIAYRQIRIEGADHSFSDQGALLSRRVLGWLERHAKGTAITR